MNTNIKEVSARVVTLNKDLVDSLLSCNISNRNARRLTIEKYKRDMAAGNWGLTHQGIAVSKDNVLIDGQHRLIACQELGYPPIQCILVTGLDFKSQKHVDQQAKRSMTDVLKIAFNKDFSNHAPAIARCIMMISDKGIMMNKVPTPDEIIKVVEEYLDEIGFACKLNKDAFFASGYLSAIAFIAKQNPARLNDIAKFVNSVYTGEMLSRKMPAYHLRSYVLNTKGSGGGREMIRERYLKTIKALECFLNGGEMGVLRI
jgi:hypothetical protein